MNILQEMSKELRIDYDFILSIVNSKRKYRIYQKGKRIIYNPSNQLKLLQYWLNNRIFNKLKYSEYTTAYQKGCSIKKNATIHSKSNYILHTDIKNFFNSITEKHIDVILDNVKDLDSDDKSIIKKIILFDGHLVIGSVSAPIVSNCVMYNFDRDLNKKIIKDSNMIYTRYADDITISSNKYIPNEIKKSIRDLLNENGFEINNKKTYFSCRASRRKITGITIDNVNNELSIGHKKYKKIKKEIYNYLIKNEGDKEQILGNLAFLKDVNINKYNNLKLIYSRYEKKRRIFSECKGEDERTLDFTHEEINKQ